MNNLEEAAALLENGWCVGEIVQRDGDKDTFCAVGAVAAQMNIIAMHSHNVVDEMGTYRNFNKTGEALALATAIVNSDWMGSLPYYKQQSIMSSFDNMDYDEVVFEFNDRQESSEPVIKMFKLAAQRLDAKT